jgi:hypothetical protein
MDWYYANNGQQAGPVSESNLDELARTGVIKPDTLVWSQGMSGWLPYATARGGGSPAVNAPPMLDQTVCSECNRPFSKNDLLRIDNNYVCADCKPTFLQRMREGVGPAGGLAWRSGNLLVLRREATLPDRCVKCNAPAQGRKLPRKYSWHAPWVWLLFFLVSPLLYVVVALIISKKARLAVGICDSHFGARKRDMLIGWLSFFLAIALFIASGYFSNGWLALAGFGIFLGGVIYAVVRVPVLSPKRIDDEFVYLKGASPAYIAELPEFPGPR